MRPPQEVHTPEEFAALTAVRKRGRPTAENPKVPVTIRLDQKTVEAFKATGAGWQTRVNDVLAKAAFTGKFHSVDISAGSKPGAGAEKTVHRRNNVKRGSDKVASPKRSDKVA